MMDVVKVKIYFCKENEELFSEKDSWHEIECNCKTVHYATAEVGKELKWSNGAEWGKIHHPHLGEVMTYWNPERPCYDTWTAPVINEDGEIICYRFDQDEGCWAFDDGCENLGLYNGIDTCKLG